MSNEIKVKLATPIVFANSGDYSSTLSAYARTAQVNLTSLANGAARQTDKVDLGATRAGRYLVRAAIELDVAPTAGTVVDFYWSSSPSATAGTGNDGGASGADGAYKAGEEDEWKPQLLKIGSLVLTADAATVVQRGYVGEFIPPERYGSVVVINESGQAFEGDAVEMNVVLLPLIDEIQ